jgi:hypothetical protein
MLYGNNAYGTQPFASDIINRIVSNAISETGLTFTDTELKNLTKLIEDTFVLSDVLSFQRQQEIVDAIIANDSIVLNRNITLSTIDISLSDILSNNFVKQIEDSLSMTDIVVSLEDLEELLSTIEITDSIIKEQIYNTINSINFNDSISAGFLYIRNTINSINFNDSISVGLLSITNIIDQLSLCDILEICTEIIRITDSIKIDFIKNFSSSLSIDDLIEEYGSINATSDVLIFDNFIKEIIKLNNDVFTISDEFNSLYETKFQDENITFNDLVKNELSKITDDAILITDLITTAYQRIRNETEIISIFDNVLKVLTTNFIESVTLSEELKKQFIKVISDSISSISDSITKSFIKPINDSILFIDEILTPEIHTNLIDLISNNDELNTAWSRSRNGIAIASQIYDRATESATGNNQYYTTTED